MKKPSVAIVTTGGTISSKYDTRGGENAPAAGAEELVASVPELGGAAQVRVVEHSNVTSDVMETATAFGLRDRLRGVLADEATAGAVVTHGDGHHGGDGLSAGPHPGRREARRDNGRHAQFRRPRRGWSQKHFLRRENRRSARSAGAGRAGRAGRGRYSLRATSSRCTPTGPIPSPRETAGR